MTKVPQQRLRVSAGGQLEREWLCARLSHLHLTPAFRSIRASDAAGRIWGVIGYDLWTYSSCVAHMAVDSPIAWRALLRPAFEYPFGECGMERIVGSICADNLRSLAMAEAMGFRQTHAIKDGFKVGVDMVLMEMAKADCRWIGGRDGQ